MKKLTIVGGGASGTLLAVNLIKHAGKQALEISLIEKKERLGRGVAYSATADFHLLNVPAAKMGAFPDDVEHFHRWLTEKGCAFAPNDFVPRRIYGEYLRDLFARTAENKPANVWLNRFDDEACDVSIDEAAVSIALRSGKKLVSDKVVLAFGNFLPPHPKSKNRAFITAEKYFQNPWNPRMLEKIGRQDDVFIVGTGLTMVDVVMSLQNAGHTGKICALSTRGLLPAVHELGHAYPSFYDELATQTKVSDLLRTVRRHVVAAESSGANWRAVIDSLRPHTQTVWLNLSKAEKTSFMRHLSRYWNVARHRIPAEAAVAVDKMRAARQLQIVKGRLKNIDTDAGGKFEISYAANQTDVRISADAIVNCIGSESNFKRIDSELVRNLIARSYIKNDALNLGIDALPDGRTLDEIGSVSNRILTFGTALKGILWESTAMPEIRAQSNKLALSLLGDD